MHSILKEADALIDGSKRDEYGSIEQSFGAIAQYWSMYLNHIVTPQDVAMMMILMKIYRETNKHKPDNLVDIVGYTKCLAHLQGIKE